LVAKEILKIIAENPRITPFEISKKAEMSAQYTRNTLRVLTELQLVKTPVRGVYLITDLGKCLLSHLDKERT